jgi:hypothetical protein
MALADTMEGPLNARRSDPDDVAGLAAGLRRVDDDVRQVGLKQTEEIGRLSGHEKICAERYGQIFEKLGELKQDHRVLRRLVLTALLVLAGIDMFGGHVMMQSLLARAGITVSVAPAPAPLATPK